LIARTAEVGSYDGLMNISQARASARRQLEEIARRKLTADWSAQPQTQRYVIASPAVTRGTEVRTYKQRRQDNAVWWKVDMQMKLDSIESTESWLIRDDGEAHRGNYELAAAGVKYTEQRVEQDNQVRRELWVLPAGVRKSSTPVDDTYAPEVVLVHAAAKMALASDGAPGIFTAIDTFAVDTVRWIVVPLGRQPLPGGKTSDKAAAVLLQRDYGPSPIVLYFDEALTMVAVNHDNVHWQTLTGGSTREGVTE